ncbi:MULTISPECIES: ABC transporter ATP-binding protein [Tetragenococcus]|uniref:Branched-chain amino acid transport ATP-binding protein n=1 Tax=Tetragenococcus muriaticus 3MR10-3 TaxID=1302648 RepID=A0A091BZ64_9ENTE|nr:MULTISPECIES: ABC transporter ATP-binding protein [Tetragenococcus]MDN6507437.1 ABC transporter ATP-binding protein [Tetragenococcus halophilus]KFN89092.1 branched-chain amino acid transport ATP-binding protein [Tetragenococcus muriaticus 3MR10-3]MCF1618072.1 ABC transporter ATP-binding protein [Tetragenococcus koreensis]MCF1622128.1 ABC transporter ATP-binding protein [Tetragenococcus koreensis]MCF1627404.1 ABC transporter ATP-binding protein [Tetragenococcus koreensis]
MALLEVKNLTKNFGGLTAVQNINLEFNKNELIGLIGPNGAGKTTLFNLLTGVYRPSQGEISFEKGDKTIAIGKRKTSDVAELGIARTFQNIRLLKDMSVLENVAVSMHNKYGAGIVSTFFRLPKFYKAEKQVTDKAMELLKIFSLEKVVNEKARNLSYGNQRRLEIVRALATGPDILFLDEPAAGMNPKESSQLTKLIYQIQRDFDLTIVLIEHDMSVVMEVCERIYVLEYGKVIAHGTPEEIRNNDKVVAAYLGGV